VKALKFRNFQSVFDLFRQHGSAAQSQLSLWSGLQASTISNYVKQLRSLGLVVPEGKGASTPEGGRPTEILVPAPDSLCVGVAHFLDNHLVFYVLDLQGAVRCTLKTPCSYDAIPCLDSLVHEAEASCALSVRACAFLPLPGMDSVDSSIAMGSASLYYHQAKAGLRQSSVLALSVLPENAGILASLSDNQGIPCSGAHGLSATRPLPVPSLENAALLGARLLDPSLVGIDVPIEGLADTIYPVRVQIAEAPGACVRGAACILQDRLLERMMYAESES